MASTEIRRTTGSTPTNAEKFTVSLWFKISNIGSNNGLFGWRENSNDGNNNLFVRIGSSGNFQIYFTSNNGNDNHITLLTNRLFRDCNAFYHAVISVDSSQSTSSDRVKLYINGVQETSFSSASYPASGRTFFSNDTQINFGKTKSTSGSDTYFDGLQSHIHFTDGYAYDATPFGETDSTTGEWKIKTSPSVSYGNNGFFWLKDSIATTDHSPNSNTFSVGDGTLTKTEDNPSNVFATLNPLDGYTSHMVFSHGNNTVDNGSTASNKSYARSTIGVSSGKYYFEAKNIANANWQTIGITDKASGGVDGELGGSGNDYVYRNGDGQKGNNNSFSSYGNTYTTNSIIGVAVDLDNNKIYFSKDGVWQNSGDPANGTYPAFTITASSDTQTGFYFFAVGDTTSANSSKWSANFGNGYFGTTAVSSAGTNASGNGIFEYDVPNGFTALSTKGLNL